MWPALKNFGRRIIPKKLFHWLQPYYHGAAALAAAAYFGRPSDKLIVIGVTGSAGKSTTINALSQILNSAGHKTGVVTTTNYFDGKTDHINYHGLSMPGGWMLQQQLYKMAANGCTHAVVECTSEGLAQNRHLGIRFYAAVITNLAPAHLDAHGGFENYRAAKARLFANAPQLLSVNLDDPGHEYFLRFKAGKKIGITLQDNKPGSPDITVYRAKPGGLEPQLLFSVDGVAFSVPLIGEFNLYNVLMATACARELGVSLEQSALALQNFYTLPGRMQEIETNRGFRVFVDYAPEPVAMSSALIALNRLPHRRLIHVFGSTGGSRDKGKRYEFGSISAALADVIIITNDDVYDSDPEIIADNIQEGINQVDHKKAAQVLVMLDRRNAINQALGLAQPGDIVVVTGKGSEQFLVLPGNQRIAWDEPSMVRESLKDLK